MTYSACDRLWDQEKRGLVERSGTEVSICEFIGSVQVPSFKLLQSIVYIHPRTKGFLDAFR